MNLDLWLVFLGGALLSAVLPGVGAILTLNHAFQRGWRKTLPLIAGQATALALMVPIVALSTEALRASAAAWLLLKSIRATNYSHDLDDGDGRCADDDALRTHCHSLAALFSIARNPQTTKPPVCRFLGVHCGQPLFY